MEKTVHIYTIDCIYEVNILWNTSISHTLIALKPHKLTISDAFQILKRCERNKLLEYQKKSADLCCNNL